MPTKKRSAKRAPKRAARKVAAPKRRPSITNRRRPTRPAVAPLPPPEQLTNHKEDEPMPDTETADAAPAPETPTEAPAEQPAEGGGAEPASTEGAGS